MNGTKIEKLYKGLCFTAIFKGVLLKTPFCSFLRYCTATGKAEKNRAYADFVAEIYEEGGNLTELVFRRVAEDENVYVKSKAKKLPLDLNIQRQAEKELSLFSLFGSLTKADFSKDLEEKDIPDFTSVNKDVVASYHERIDNIGKYGYGIFSSHGMFRLSDERVIEPIVSIDNVTLDDFIGYEEERGKVIDNTKAFLLGKPAANVLLCGDAGAGKSSTVKAVANAFFDDGLRLIELRKDQLRYFPQVMAQISGNPLKFIVFIDDLSFNKSDDNFSMLKAALEGSASAKAENAVIYATSNRRHIVKESFGDREGDDVHRNDTMQEILSLSERFGLTVLFSKPNKALYLTIVRELVKRFEIQIDMQDLEVRAEAFALRKGSRSPRCAKQFVKSLL